jgi:flagellar protein FliO/FliZ
MDLDVTTYLRFALALVIVLGLIALAAKLARRVGFGQRLLAPSRGRRRLHVVEMIALDARRRLAIVRRDDREHLLLLGLQSDVVVETDITAPASDREADSAP